MIKDASQDTRFLQIETPFGAGNVFLQSIEGSDGLSELFEYQLELLTDPKTPLAPSEIVGKTVTVTLLGQAGRKRFIHGYVNSFEYLGQDETQAAYRARLVPWLWFLTQRRDCRIFQRETVPAIVEKVFQHWGFTDFDRSFLQADYPTLDYCVQYRETDFQFVSRLLEEYGIFYFFRHQAGRHVLVLADNRSAYFDLPEPKLDYFSAGTHGEVAQIQSWNRQVAFCSGKVSLTDYDFQQPSSNLLNDRATQLPYSLINQCEWYDFPGRFVKKNDGRNLSRIKMESFESQHNRVNASSNIQAVTAGGMFTLMNHPHPGEAGQQHVIVQSRLKAQVDGFRSGGSGGDGPAFQNEFTCIPAKTLFRPQQQTLRPVVEGPQTAVVVGPAGEEIYVDDFGRVKCQFHWDRLGQRDQNSSCWIRVSQLHAGKNFGAIDIPRIGEEVIVSFLNGDPDFPIITGRVYNGANQVPFSLSGDGNAQNKTRRGQISKTYKGKGYNEVSMDDTPGKEQLRVQAQYNMNTTVKNDQTLFVGNNQSISVCGTQELTVGKTQTVTIGSDQSIGVGGKKEESIAKDFTLSVGGSWSANAKGEIRITGDGGIDLICGSSIISIQKDNITMNSPRINLFGGSEVNVMASGIVSINGSVVKVNC